MVHVNGAFRVSAWAGNRPLSTQHSADYQCAWPEMMHSSSVLSKATVGSYSLADLRGEEIHLGALQGMINVIHDTLSNKLFSITLPD